MTFRPVLQLLLLGTVFAHAFGCSCPAQTFGQRYRSSPVVVKARVLSVKFVPPPSPPACLDAFPPCLPLEIFPQPFKYTFRLLATFRGCAPKKIFFGQSSESSAACGITLKKGRVYMLNLAMEKGTKSLPFSLSLCQGNVLFGKLSKGQKRFLLNQSTKKKNMCMK